MLIGVLTMTGAALAVERPTVEEGCLSDPGICFGELEGAIFCAYGLTEPDGDFWRFCIEGDVNDYIKLTPNGKFFQHAVENRVIYLDACPAMMSGAACDLLGPLDPNIDFQSDFDGVTGFGRISFSSSGECTWSIHGSGVVHNSAGENFDMDVNSVGHPGPNGCVIVVDELRITPSQP